MDLAEFFSFALHSLSGEHIVIHSCGFLPAAIVMSEAAKWLSPFVGMCLRPIFVNNITFCCGRLTYLYSVARNKSESSYKKVDSHARSLQTDVYHRMGFHLLIIKTCKFFYLSNY